MTQPNERVSVRLEDGRRRQGRVVRLESVRVKQGGHLRHIIADDERELLRTARARPLMSAVEELGGDFSMLDENELRMSVRYAESLLKLQTLRKQYEMKLPRYESELLKLDAAVENTFYHFPEELTPGLVAEEHPSGSTSVRRSIHTTRAFHNEEHHGADHHGADHHGVAEYYPSPHSKPPPLPPQLASHEINHHHHGAPPVTNPQSIPASQHHGGGSHETIHHRESHDEQHHQYFSSPPPMPESVKKSLRRKTTRKSSSKHHAPPLPPPPPPLHQPPQPPAPPAHVPLPQFPSTPTHASSLPHRHGEPQPPAPLQQSLAPSTPSTWHAPVLARSDEPVHERALFPAAVSFIKYNVLTTRSRQPPKSSLFMPGSKAKYVDLRPTMPPVYEPIRWISCSAAMALCAGYEHAVASPSARFNASPLFLYLNERYVDQPRPSAFTMESAALSMQQLGVCSEDVFGSQAAGVGSAIVKDSDLRLPGPEAYQSAAAHPVELHRIKCERKDIIRCLQSGFVIVTAVHVFYSFHECPSDGFVTMPERGEHPFDQENEGGQGIVIVGFDEECDDGVWIVRNSRGRSWGLEGHAYLPFGYEKYFGDLFVVSYPA